MKNIILPICCAAALCMVPTLMSGCNSDPKDGSAPDGPPIDVPPGDVTVAAYYFPNWGPVATSEWGSLQRAKPMFDGHKQPKVPAWGYRNENRPEVMQQKIDAAADHGLDVFIFDWYFYDEAQMPGNKYLSSALEEGFLKAPNNDRMKFSLLWCNHDLGEIARGAVTPETFELLTDYVIEHYFKHPSYWLVDGCPYFSIYEVNTFLATFGGDYARAGEAIARFRAADGGIDFVLQAPPSLRVDVDTQMVRMAIDNLLGNALKHSPDDTAVLIETHENKTNDAIVTNVVNFGSQIPVEARSDIFRRFVKGKTGPGTESGGTGLGLSIARWAAQLHGGTVRVVDDPRGADFEITLPKHHIQADVAKSAHSGDA